MSRAHPSGTRTLSSLTPGGSFGREATVVVGCRLRGAGAARSRIEGRPSASLVPVSAPDPNTPNHFVCWDRGVVTCGRRWAGSRVEPRAGRIPWKQSWGTLQRRCNSFPGLAGIRRTPRTGWTPTPTMSRSPKINGPARSYPAGRGVRARMTWCLGAESNHRHGDFQSPALPSELPRHVFPGAMRLRRGDALLRSSDRKGNPLACGARRRPGSVIRPGEAPGTAIGRRRAPARIRSAAPP